MDALDGHQVCFFAGDFLLLDLFLGHPWVLAIYVDPSFHRPACFPCIMHLLAGKEFDLGFVAFLARTRRVRPDRTHTLSLCADHGLLQGPYRRSNSSCEWYYTRRSSIAVFCKEQALYFDVRFRFFVCRFVASVVATQPNHVVRRLSHRSSINILYYSGIPTDLVGRHLKNGAWSTSETLMENKPRSYLPSSH
jgi:hypothetical protein